jgi:uncharacterized protein (TIGR02246 family)
MTFTLHKSNITLYLSALALVFVLFEKPVSAGPSSQNPSSPSAEALHENVKLEVLTASREWIKNFNAGNARACADGYSEDAVMEAKPFGTYKGRENIYNFWKDLIENKKAAQLTYKNVNVQVLHSHKAILSADWTMTIGGGIITKELWSKESGHWELLEDYFEVK